MTYEEAAAVEEAILSVELEEVISCICNWMWFISLVSRSVLAEFQKGRVFSKRSGRGEHEEIR